MGRHARTRRYRSRMDIIPDTGTRNQGGQHIPDYSGPPRAESWPCQWMQKAQAEQVYGRQMQEITTHVIECRYIDNVSTDDQILIKRDGLRLNVVSALYMQLPRVMLIIEAVEDKTTAA